MLHGLQMQDAWFRTEHILCRLHMLGARKVAILLRAAADGPTWILA